MEGTGRGGRRLRLGPRTRGVARARLCGEEDDEGEEETHGKNGIIEEGELYISKNLLDFETGGAPVEARAPETFRDLAKV